MTITAKADKAFVEITEHVFGNTVRLTLEGAMDFAAALDGAILKAQDNGFGHVIDSVVFKEPVSRRQYPLYNPVILARSWFQYTKDRLDGRWTLAEQDLIEAKFEKKRREFDEMAVRDALRSYKGFSWGGGHDDREDARHLSDLYRRKKPGWSGVKIGSIVQFKDYAGSLCPGIVVAVAGDGNVQLRNLHPSWGDHGIIYASYQADDADLLCSNWRWPE